MADPWPAGGGSRFDAMMDGSRKLELCDSEPIHIPGSIQPHGVMLLAARDGLRIRQAAGDVEAWFNIASWAGLPLATLLGPDLTDRVIELLAGPDLPRTPGSSIFIGQFRPASGVLMDVSIHLAKADGEPADPHQMVVVELEPAAEHGVGTAQMLDRMDAATTEFQRAAAIETLCAAAAASFRRFTGFDRVMIYRFLDDDAGRVVAEDRRADLRSFLNHHFPATDIPRQARALYLRNLVRVIPDIHYTPAPLRPLLPGATIDMSDSGLRSVSPVHLRYLFNMGVNASASFSIVKDGVLWGLVACHHETPRRIPYDIRVACRTLAAALAREIKGKEEAEGYRQRLRLRRLEDDAVHLLSREGSLDEALVNHLGDVQRLMTATGVAVLRGHELVTAGLAPPRHALRDLAGWVLGRGPDPVFGTDRLSELNPAAAAYREPASGLLAIVLSAEERWLVLWFRAEQVETVNWAGKPQFKETLSLDDVLTPRASFDRWAETVHGHARRWTLPEHESAARLRATLLDVRQHRRLSELNRQLTEILRDKDQLLQQKEFLMGEVNHRVQNSLQLVSSFLALQARNTTEPGAVAALDEARRRLTAVGLVHRRLYRGDQIEMIDAARYIEELSNDALASMGEDWRPHLSLDLAPVMVSTDRAVTLGLVLTELLININKYAYAGAAGPLAIRLAEDRTSFQLSVSDQGVGRKSAAKGFGSRMMQALVQQLGGDLEYQDNRPGLRAVLTASSAS